MLEFLGQYATAVNHPLIAGALGFLCGCLAGFRLGLWRYRGARLNDTLRAVSASIARQLETHPLTNAGWFGPEARDHCLVEMPAWRRRRLQRAWGQYLQACEQQREPNPDAPALLRFRDVEAVRQALLAVHRAVRPM